MHRVRGRCSVVHNDSKAFGLSNINDVLIGVELISSICGRKEKRVMKICSECLVVHGPKCMPSFIGPDGDVNSDSLFGNGCGCYWKQRLNVGAFVDTCSDGIIPWLSSWHDSGIWSTWAVVKNCHSLRLVGAGALILNNASHPEGFACRVELCFDNDIRPLGNPELEDVGLVWLDRNEVECNDCHLMLVNAEVLQTFCSSVDDTKTVLLSRLNNKVRNSCVLLASEIGFGAVVRHSAID